MLMEFSIKFNNRKLICSDRNHWFLDEVWRRLKGIYGAFQGHGMHPSSPQKGDRVCGFVRDHLPLNMNGLLSYVNHISIKTIFRKKKNTVRLGI
jgi:hypothetical protein